MNVPNKIAALLYEFNDDMSAARYVRTWPPQVEPVTRSQYEDFYRRHGEGDVKLGEERVTEDGKLDPKQYIFFEPEEPEVCINPQNIFDLNKLNTQYERLMQELEQNGRLSLANAFTYLLRKARIMRYNSCFLMLIGLKNYYWHVFYNKASPEEEHQNQKRKKEGGAINKLSEPKRGLHMPMKNLVEACLELDIWLKRQETYHCDKEKAEQLRSLLDPKLIKLLDEQLEVVQKELLLRAIDIFDYPEWYKELSDQYLENVHEEVAFLGFSPEELSGPFPRPIYHLGLEDECRQSLYRRIVSQAIDSYFYNDWNARMELWAFQKSPRSVLSTSMPTHVQVPKPQMQFIASKPMGDLTDTRVPGVVYIATEVGVKLIAIKRCVFG